MIRRSFLVGVGAAAALASGGLALIAAARLPWDALAKRLTGRLILPGGTGYEAYARPNNLRYVAAQPGGIALCENAHDVRNAILWARENAVPLVARSGGHSYAGYSTTGGLMIDMLAMHSVALDEQTGIATIGGGARNADVFKVLNGRNIAATHGRCPGVGIAGLVLGGGIGFNMRAHGFTCDELKATEIVTADGQIQSISGDDELFWACRGAGGGNFGINTSFRIQTYDVGPMTVFNLIWDKEPERVFAALAAALENAPTALGSKLSAIAPTTESGIKVQLLGQYAGPEADLREMIASAYAIAEPTGVVTTKPYWEAQSFLSEPGTPAYYQEKSRFFNQAIDHATIATVFRWLHRYPKTAHEAAFKLFQTGGRTNDVRPDATAFVHRQSRWLSSIELFWKSTTPPDALQHNLAWLTDFYAAIVPMAKGGAYQNFIDPSLTDWKTAYHGTNLPRLEAIKKRVDPTRLFTFPEAI